MTTLSAQYGQFTPQERLRLTLAAAERGDQAEVHRLMRSCPETTRSIPDPEYTGGLLWMQAAVHTVIIQWVDVSALVQYASLSAESDSAEEGALEATATAAWKKSSATWRGIEAGIRRFSAEADLTWDQVLVLAEGRPEFIEWTRRLLHPDAQPDRQCARGTCQKLWQGWQAGKEA
jgi:hypothetical protein